MALEKYLSNFIFSNSNKYRPKRRKKTFLDRCTEIANDILLITDELINEITIFIKEFRTSYKEKKPAVKIFNSVPLTRDANNTSSERHAPDEEKKWRLRIACYSLIMANFTDVLLTGKDL